jgi:hypothetical protein
MFRQYIMVLSTSTRASSISSIVNQSQGGGSKKAGLPPAHTAATNVAFALRGYQQTVARMATTANPNVCMSRPTGMIANVTRMKC